MSTQALTLYQIEDDLLALANTAEMVEDEQAQLAILDEIKEKTEQAVAKRDGVIRLIRFCEHQQAGVKAEIDRLRKLSAHYATTQERVANYVVGIIEQFVEQPKKGTKRLEGSIGILKLAKNPDSLIITDESEIPSEFKNVMISVPAATWEKVARFVPEEALREFSTMATFTTQSNAKAIKDVLKKGGEVPGADLEYGKNRLEVK